MPDVKQMDLINKKIADAYKKVHQIESQIQSLVKKMSGADDAKKKKMDMDIKKLAMDAEKAAAQVVKLKAERTKIASKA